ncbi:MAG: transcriptional repressor [Acholeplasmatales bacterium]|jgi:Fe2+ or Zn2+ uptake regulation protein|nr:transcriptional repressor [Acholeplasmatales bacterium]
MTKFILNSFYQQLKKKNKRITKARRAILEILCSHPYEFKKLYQACKYEGNENLSTFYNNIQFLKEEYAIREIFFDKDNRYYEIILDKANRYSKDIIYVLDETNQEAYEEVNDSVIEYIKNLPEYKDFGINGLNVLIRRKG